MTLATLTKAQDYGVILLYHRFGDIRYPSTSIDLKTFEKQMRYLREHNYNVVSLKKFFQYWKKKNFPPRTVAITVDDGYKSTMEGFKILKKYNFPFTVFLYMKAVDRYPDFLTKKQIQVLKKSGLVSFENHSFSHPHFGKLKKGESRSTKL